MAILRDINTSAVIAEGTPAQIALIGRELGYDKVLFDDVTPAFDPDAAIKNHEENLAGIESARKELAKAPKKNADMLEPVIDSKTRLEKEHEEALSQVEDAAKAAEAAQARVEG